MTLSKIIYPTNEKIIKKVIISKSQKLQSMNGLFFRISSVDLVAEIIIGVQEGNNRIGIKAFLILVWSVIVDIKHPIVIMAKVPTNIIIIKFIKEKFVGIFIKIKKGIKNIISDNKT